MGETSVVLMVPWLIELLEISYPYRYRLCYHLRYRHALRYALWRCTNNEKGELLVVASTQVGQKLVEFQFQQVFLND